MDRTLTDRIQALDDASALHAVAVLAEMHQVTPDVQSGRELEKRIVEALAQVDVQEYRDAPAAGAPRGAVARLVLVHFAEQGEGKSKEVEQALSQASAPHRFDPVTLGLLGAMVLYAFSTEIKLEKKPGVGWSFRFHHPPLTKSTTGRLLGQLFKLWSGG